MDSITYQFSDSVGQVVDGEIEVIGTINGYQWGVNLSQDGHFSIVDSLQIDQGIVLFDP